jgi:uncharacterized protein (TIGR03437 family)
MVRMPNRRILCSFEWHGAIYVRSSSDEGRTWANPVTAASYEFGTASNPELLVLQNGSILLSYNERPTDGIHPFTIKISFSQDNGKTWSTGRLIYGAGATSGTGCWEPAQVQLASGEIDLFFSNENLYPSTNEQQITLVRSFDNGVTWSPPEVASFRPGHRDGMAVPLRLNDGSGVVLAIEDNGMAGAFKPAVVSPAGSQRWAALETELPPAVYAGAPYLGQFPTGETVLSVQSADDRNSPGTLDSSRMVVYVGDSRAHGFTNASEPFTVPAGSNGLWNSLFIKNPVTVTAISGTTVGGVAGLWAIDGHLEYQGELPGPAIETVTNAAGGSAGPVAPGELVSIFGFGLDRAKSQSGSGTTVYFNGLASPNASVSDTQITALVPDGVSEIADTVVDCGGAKTYPYALGVTPAAPEVFTQTDGTSQAVATNADSSFNSPAKPAAKGSYLSFWGTGQGHVVSAGGYLKPVLPVRATLGGVDAEVSFAGLIYPGVLQVNIKVPVDAPSSDAVQLILTIGSGASRKTATIAVQ